MFKVEIQPFLTEFRHKWNGIWCGGEDEIESTFYLSANDGSKENLRDQFSVLINLDNGNDGVTLYKSSYAGDQNKFSNLNGIFNSFSSFFNVWNSLGSQKLNIKTFFISLNKYLQNAIWPFPNIYKMCVPTNTQAKERGRRKTLLKVLKIYFGAILNVIAGNQSIDFRPLPHLVEEKWP